jgi:hypothetical protein
MSAKNTTLQVIRTIEKEVVASDWRIVELSTVPELYSADDDK